MEGRQHYRQSCRVERLGGRVVTHDGAHRIDKRIENAQHPQHSEHVEHQVGKRRTPCLAVCPEGGKVGSSRRSDVLSHHEGYSEVYRQHAARAQHHRNGHQRGRRLEYARKHGTDKKEHYYSDIAARIERAEEADKLPVVAKVKLVARLAEQGEREEHKRYAEKKVAHVAVTARIDEQYADNEGGKHRVHKVERESQTHYPGRKRGADVGAHDDGYCLGQRQQAGVDERDGHHRRCRRRLDGARYEHSGEHTGKPVSCHCA